MFIVDSSERLVSEENKKQQQTNQENFIVLYEKKIVFRMFKGRQQIRDTQ